MAIHIDIYAHLKKQALIKEGEQLKRYVDSLEKDANQRLERGAQGRSAKLVKLNDQQAASYDRVINASDAYVAAKNRELAIQQKIKNIKRRSEKTDEQAEKKVEALAEAERELTDAELNRAFAAQQLTKSVNDQTRAVKDLNDENDSHTKRLRQVNRLVKDNKKDFANLTRATNKQRRELESLSIANQAVTKDNAGFVKQMERVSDATQKTTAERAKYNEMVKEGTATHKQYREQSERVRSAHQAEQRVIRDTTASLSDLLSGRERHDAFVHLAADRLRNLERATIASRQETERLHASNQGVIRDSAALTRVFDSVADSTDKAFREHQKYTRMANDSSSTQEQLRAQLDRTTDAYARQATNVKSASSALRRHHEAEVEAQRREALSGSRNRDMDVGRWAARNLGALTPLGTVTPTLVLPLGTAFVQIANGAVAASQSIALLPAVLTAAAAGIGTLKMATSGFGDTIDALMKGDLKKFAEGIAKLSPSAQQAALTFQHLLPEIKAIQQAAQEAFFKDSPQMGFALFKTLGPTISKMTTGIATSMNQSMMNVGNLLMTPDNLRSIDLITGNITKSFQMMEPAVVSVTQAFLTLTRQGSILLPGMSKDISEVAANFSKFLGEARESGALKEFMRQGWEALKAVGAALLDFGKMLYDVFGLKSQEDVARFKQTMQEMTDLLQVVLGTMKKLFEDIAGVFRGITDFFSIFGVELGTVSSGLAMIAEGWLFVHGLKKLKDLAAAARDFKLAMMGASAAGAGASVVGGAAATGGGAVAGSLASRALPWLGGASLVAATGSGAAGGVGGLVTALGAMLGPITAATGAIVGLGAAAIWATHKLSDKDRDLPPGAAPTTEGLATGAIPGSTPTSAPGLKPPELSMQDKVKLKYSGLMDAQGKFTVPLEKIYQALGRPLPKPESPLKPGEHVWGTGESGGPPNPLESLGSPFKGGAWPGPFDIPGIPTTASDFQSVPGTFEMSQIPIGQFGGANWDVPHGVMDVPRTLKPGDTGFGKPGQWNVDPWEVTQAQWRVDDQRQRVEEQRKQYLATQQDANKTQDDINKAAHNVIEAERGWMEAMRGLKEAERGEFDAFSKQTRTFADDLRDSLGDLGAALDPDFGISKGLAGIADNLVKFVATLAAAPILGAMKGRQAGLGFPNGKGVGSGLIGMEAARRGYFQRDDEQAAYWQQYGMGGQGGSYGPGPGNYGLTPGMGNPRLDAMYGLAESTSGKVKYAPASDLVAGLADCSGSVSDLYEVIKYGQANAGREFDTTNFATPEGAAALGFQPGFVPGAFNVGVTPLPGKAGHMAATLPNMVNYEGGGATGGGGLYGGKATGALDPQFSVRYHLPIPQGTAYGPQQGVFDDGGVLPPGPSIVINNTGKPEPLVNPLSYGLGDIPKAPAPKVPEVPKPDAPIDLTNPGLTPLPPGVAEQPRPEPSPFYADGATPSPVLTPGGAVVPLGVPTQGSTIGSKVEPYAGYGSGLKVGGGLLGSAIGAAASAAGAAGGGPAAAAGMQIGIQEITRAIEFGAEAAGIGVQGVIDTVLPAGGSKLAQENWITRIAGGIVGAAPALPNLAGNGGALGQGVNLPGVGPATPEQIAAQGMDPNRTVHTGTGPPPGPSTTNGIGHVENLIMKGSEDRLGQDIARYQKPGAR